MNRYRKWLLIALVIGALSVIAVGFWISSEEMVESAPAKVAET